MRPRPDAAENSGPDRGVEGGRGEGMTDGEAVVGSLRKAIAGLDREIEEAKGNQHREAELRQQRAALQEAMETLLTPAGGKK